LPRFDNFLPETRAAIVGAVGEAKRLDHNYVGTEHLLAGLIAEPSGRASRVLTGAKLDLDRVRSAIELIVGRGDTPPTEEPGLTPRARRAIAFSSKAAERLGHASVGTEHLLLAVLQDDQSLGVRMLQTLQVDPAQLEAALWRDLDREAER
jgi:ATP-dependent Clp protease ATP-binding subunit ClpC